MGYSGYVFAGREMGRKEMDSSGREDTSGQHAYVPGFSSRYGTYRKKIIRTERRPSPSLYTSSQHDPLVSLRRTTLLIHALHPIQQWMSTASVYDVRRSRSAGLLHIITSLPTVCQRKVRYFVIILRLYVHVG